MEKSDVVSAELFFEFLEVFLLAAGADDDQR